MGEGQTRLSVTLLEGDDGFSLSRNSNDTAHPNLTLPDLSPLNQQIRKVRQEAEELLNKTRQKLDHPESGDVDGKAAICHRSSAFPVLPGLSCLVCPAGC